MGWPIKLAKPKQDADVPEKKQNYRFVVGEYLPWKGFMFRVTEVKENGFSAEVVGVTKKLAHLVKKDER